MGSINTYCRSPSHTRNVQTDLQSVRWHRRGRLVRCSLDLFEHCWRNSDLDFSMSRSNLHHQRKICSWHHLVAAQIKYRSCSSDGSNGCWRRRNHDCLFKVTIDDTQQERERERETLPPPLSSDIMDNRVFYQHPDLMRSLCVHETIMAIMVNRLNKSKQEQTSMSSSNDMDGLTQTNDSGENQELHPMKVNISWAISHMDLCSLSRLIGW